MKRILIYILALVTLFILVGCDKDGSNDVIEGDKYVAQQSHLYPYAPSYLDYDYWVVIDGTQAEIAQVAHDGGTNDSGAYTEDQTTRMTGTVKLEDGYYVVTVKKLYNSVKYSGEGAQTQKNAMIQSAQDAIEGLDHENTYYEDYVARYELMIEMYGGKEVDATSMSLSEFNSVVYKVKLDDKNGKITEMQMFADGASMGGYTFEYDANGVMTRSTEYDNDNDLWETEYRADGTPSFFKYTSGDEVLAFSCDESGNLTEVAED